MHEGSYFLILLVKNYEFVCMHSRILRKHVIKHECSLLRDILPCQAFFKIVQQIMSRNVEINIFTNYLYTLILCLVYSYKYILHRILWINFNMILQIYQNSPLLQFPAKKFEFYCKNFRIFQRYKIKPICCSISLKFSLCQS